MTTKEEEAIRDLKKLKSFHNGSYGEVLNMAIKALESSISIPSGATNGDVIKTVFPRIKHSFTDKDSKVYILEPNDILTPILTSFDSWWNEPYKRGEKDEVSD